MPPESQNNQTPNNPPSSSPLSPPQPSNNSPQSPQPPAGVQPAFGQQTPAQPPKKSNKKRWLLAAIIALVVLIGGSAAAYFGYYLPSQPDQIWKRALSNSSAGIDKLNEYYNSQGETSEKGSIKGDFRFEENGNVVDGNVETKYDPVNTATKLDAGFMGIRLDAEVLTNIPEGSKYPDVYAKVNGLEGLDQILGGEAGAAVDEFNGQWYVVDHTLFDQMMSAATEKDASPTLSREDINGVVTAFNRVNNEYIFTDDSSKAVLVRKQDVGREKLNDRDTYRYKVGYNKQNLQTYSNELKEALKQTKLNEYMTDSDFDGLNEEIEQLSGEGEADVWVDMKTKLFRQIRFNDVGREGDYIDLALNYNGGDEYPFVVTMVGTEEGEAGTGTISVTLNTSSNEVKFDVNVEGETAGKPMKFNAAATMAPSNEEVGFNKPGNAKSLLEAFGGLLGGNGAFSDPAGFSSEINEL